MENLQYLKGDATSPVGDGIKIILHVCNDVGAWGKGFVLAISSKWKTPELHYKSLFDYNNKPVLGDIQFLKVEDNVYVVNMIAQHGIRYVDGIPPIRYNALEQCLQQVATLVFANFYIENASFHLPRIGCGLAGGTWNKVEPIIINTIACKLKTFVYDLE